MNLSADLREFIELLSSHVDYLIIGAHRLAFRGRPRYSKIRNKQAVDGPQDIADLDALG